MNIERLIKLLQWVMKARQTHQQMDNFMEHTLNRVFAQEGNGTSVFDGNMCPLENGPFLPVKSICLSLFVSYVISVSVSIFLF